MLPLFAVVCVCLSATHACFSALFVCSSSKNHSHFVGPNCRAFRAMLWFSSRGYHVWLEGVWWAGGGALHAQLFRNLGRRRRWTLPCTGFHFVGLCAYVAHVCTGWICMLVTYIYAIHWLLWTDNCAWCRWSSGGGVLSAAQWWLSHVPGRSSADRAFCQLADLWCLLCLCRTCCRTMCGACRWEVVTTSADSNMCIIRVILVLDPIMKMMNHFFFNFATIAPTGHSKNSSFVNQFPHVSFQLSHSVPFRCILKAYVVCIFAVWWYLGRMVEQCAIRTLYNAIQRTIVSLHVFASCMDYIDLNAMWWFRAPGSLLYRSRAAQRKNREYTMFAHWKIEGCTMADI